MGFFDLTFSHPECQGNVYQAPAIETPAALTSEYLSGKPISFISSFSEKERQEEGNIS